MRPLADLEIFFRPPTRGLFDPNRESVIRIPQLHLPLRCYYCCRTELSAAFFQRRRKQPFFSVEYIYSGEFHIRVGGIGYVAEPGDLCCIAPGSDCELLYLPGRGKCRKAGLIFSGPLLDGVLHALGLEDNPVIGLRDRERFEGLRERLWNALLNSDSAAGREDNAGAALAFFQFLADQRRTPAVPADMMRLRDHLIEHCAENLSMPDLAAMARMSLPTLNRKFLAAFHATPYQYLIRLRMNRAAHLLLSEPMSIKEIAFRCGYATPLHFSAEFRRRFRCSPRQYRKTALTVPPADR